MKDALYKVKILRIIETTHDVRTFQVTKPPEYSYEEGQATELSIDDPLLRTQMRPFTFTGITTDDYLEFTIKMYGTHKDGMTKHLRDLRVGDSLIVRDTR